MRRLVCGALMALAMSSLLAKAPASFLTSWPEAQQAAQAGQKLIYLHFTTDWCSWCRKIEADTYPDPRVQKALAGLVAVSLNCTASAKGLSAEAQKTNRELFQRFGGQGYPFLVIVSADGETVYRTIGGYVPPESFLRELDAAAACQKEYLAR